MAISSRKDLMEHLGHEIMVVYYGPQEDPASVTLECVDCGSVLIAAEDLEEHEAVCEQCGEPCEYDSDLCLCDECRVMGDQFRCEITGVWHDIDASVRLQDGRLVHESQARIVKRLGRPDVALPREDT